MAVTRQVERGGEVGFDLVELRRCGAELFLYASWLVMRCCSLAMRSSGIAPLWMASTSFYRWAVSLAFSLASCLCSHSAS